MPHTAANHLAVKNTMSPFHSFPINTVQVRMTLNITLWWLLSEVWNLGVDRWQVSLILCLRVCNSLLSVEKCYDLSMTGQSRKQIQKSRNNLREAAGAFVNGTFVCTKSLNHKAFLLQTRQSQLFDACIIFARIATLHNKNSIYEWHGRLLQRYVRGNWNKCVGCLLE